MPLRFDVEEYLGTNSDGSRSDEFCYYLPEGWEIHC
ncbi:zinc ribbon domain-containing protein [Bacteroides thetaiotaomicron]|nr:zinc ribbon domain-containing protein [Bacteroides thetaiotaomicron]